MNAITRRVLLGAGASLCLPPAPSSALPGQLDFSILRAGIEIGRHELRLSRGGAGFTVDIRIDYAAELAASRYQHRSREVWSDDRLVSLDASTTDGGRGQSVRGRAVAEGFLVETTNQLLDSRIVPTSWWNPRILSERQALSTTTGQLIAIAVASKGTETIEAWGRPIDATRYQVSGGVQGEIWYDERATWVKSRLPGRDGAMVDYLLR